MLSSARALPVDADVRGAVPSYFLGVLLKYVQCGTSGK